MKSLKTVALFQLILSLSVTCNPPPQEKPTPPEAPKQNPIVIEMPKAISIEADFNPYPAVYKSGFDGYFFADVGCCGDDSRILIKVNSGIVSINRYGSAPPCERLLEYQLANESVRQLKTYLDRCFVENNTEWSRMQMPNEPQFEVKYVELENPFDPKQANELKYALEEIEITKENTGHYVYAIQTNDFYHLFAQIGKERYESEYQNYRKWLRNSKDLMQ